jgi:catechol 2,3-dioxygenase-like lactoylglutathione lyase family enzyme
MTNSPITGISHAILWVRDLEAAAERYRRLGFSLSQHYLHPKSVGTANYNAMFEDDYLELLTPVEKNERNAQRLARIDAEGDGLKDLSLATRDADAAYEVVRSAGLAPLPVFDHHRPEGNETARFRIVYLPADRLLPGLGIHVNQRVTPELMWRNQNTVHANGARGIAGLVCVAPDPAAMAAPFAKFFGVDVEPAGGLSVKAGKAIMRFVTPSQLMRHFPNVAFKPTPPFVAVLELFAADPEQTRQYLARTGVPHREADGGAIEVAPDEACGVVLRFVRRS